MRLLLTGGAGYIGSHCCKYLSEKNEVLAIDSLERGHREFLRYCPFIEGRVEDEEFLNKIFQEFLPQAVVHLAGYIDVAESVRKPELYVQKNVEVTKTLVAAMSKFGIKKLIYSSTGSVYDSSSNARSFTEEDACSPLNPYAKSKLGAEFEIKKSCEENGLNAVVFRYFNAAGADASGEIGEMHNPETHVIPILIESMIKNTVFTVNGDNFQTPDGTAVRDYIHVLDIASAHISALKFLEKSEGFNVFNIGTGTGTSVKQLVVELAKITNKKIKTVYGEKRVGDAEMLVANSQKAQKLLNWQPVHSDIENILKTALAWHKTFS